MLFCDRDSDCQAQARAATRPFGSEKWIKNFGQAWGRDAGAVVRELEYNFAFVLTDRHPNRSAVPRAGYRLFRVGDQVNEYLLQQPGIRFDLSVNPAAAFSSMLTFFGRNNGACCSTTFRIISSG